MKRLTLILAMVFAFVSFKASADVSVWVNTSSTSYYLYAWDTNGTSLLGTWPGTQFSALSSTTYDGETYYGTTFVGYDEVSVIFNTNGGGQTGDITGLTGTNYFKYSGGTSYTVVSSSLEYNEITVYVASSSSSYYMYVWEVGGAVLTSWPGEQFSSLSTTTVDGTSYYYKTVATTAEQIGVIFNEGDSSAQTDDIFLTEDGYFVYNGGTSYTVVDGSSTDSGSTDSGDTEYTEYTANLYISATYAEYNYIYAWNEEDGENTGEFLGAWDDKPLINTGTATEIDGETYYLFTFTGTGIYVILVDGYGNQTGNISIPEGDTYICYDGGTDYTEGKRTAAATVTSVAYYLAGEKFATVWADALQPFSGADGEYTLEYDKFYGQFKVVVVSTYSDETETTEWYGYGEADDYYGITLDETYVLDTAGANMVIGLEGYKATWSDVAFVLTVAEDGTLSLVVSSSDESGTVDDGDDSGDDSGSTTTEEFTANFFIHSTYADSNYIYAWGYVSGELTYYYGAWPESDSYTDLSAISSVLGQIDAGGDWYLAQLTGTVGNEIGVKLVGEYGSSELQVTEAGDYYIDIDDYSTASWSTDAPVGISNLAADGRTVVAEKYYNLAGVEVAEPTNDAKAMYIVVRNYSDGTASSAKVIR